MELKNKLIKLYFKDNIKVQGKNLVSKLLRFKDYPKKMINNSEDLIIKELFTYSFMGSNLGADRLLISESPLWKNEESYTIQLISNFNDTKLYFSKIIYYEIILTEEKIQEDWENSCISIGLGKKPEIFKIQSGWTEETVGYHSDDGGIFNGSPLGCFVRKEPFEKGDIIGCGCLKKDSFINYFFTKNGRIIFKDNIYILSDIYALIGLDYNYKIEVNFGQKPFAFNLEKEYFNLLF